MANTQSDSSRGVESRIHDGVTLQSGRRIQYESPVARRHVTLVSRSQTVNVISIQDSILLLCTHSSGVSSTLQQLHTRARRDTLRVF